MFQLKKLREQVYQLEFDSARELGMAFVRYQEFYESPYDSIREKSFTLVEQMGMYVRKQLEDPEKKWSYPQDWGGYNMPVETIKQVHDLGIKDPNFYDSFMFGVYGLIMADTCNEKAYLIGTYVDEDDQKKQESYIKHEVTHAMFYLDKEYRTSCLEFLDSIPKSLREELVKAMKDNGYPEKTSLDEIQAYITTGEAGYFDLVEDQENLDELRIMLRKLHRERYPIFYS